jgi:hypothetical protein
MKKRKYINSKIIYLLGLFIIIATGCERDITDDAVTAGFGTNPEVYIDGFSSGLEYLPFSGSVVDAFSVDEDTKYAGTSSMRFDVPNVGDPGGSYAGAIFPDYGGRDLSGYDALTFWAKGTEGRTINDIGFGQDFLENKYQVKIQGALRLTTNWRKYTIPIPDPAKLIQENGMFWYAEGPDDNGTGWTFWIDELQFEKLGTIGQPRPAIYGGDDIAVQTFIGVQNQVSDLQFTANLENGADQTLSITPGYFTFESSDSSVVKVNELGQVLPVGIGEAVVTAFMNGVEAAGSGTYKVLGEFKNAPTPTQDASDVISIFSNAYVNEPVDYYNGYWAPFQTTQGQDDLNINGDDIIFYSDLNFVGIQFAVDAPTINASTMTHFHIDIQVQDTIQSGDFLTVRIADAGADNTIGNEDDSSAEIMLTSTLVQGDWLSVDVPFTDLASLTSRSNLAQIVFVSDATIENIYVDNIYFYKGTGGGPDGPTVGAPVPTRDAADVVSVFSDTYTNIPNTDFNPDWGQSTVFSQEQIAGNNTLVYKGLDYQGVVFETTQDVSAMTHLYVDVWTDNSSALNAFLISTGGVETASALTVPTSGWVGFDILLSSFSPVNLAELIQMKFDGNGNVYLDNIYFYKGGGSATEPTVAAPTPPSRDAANVLSVFSDAYVNIDISELNPDWGQSTEVTTEDIAGNQTLKYANFNYQGMQFAGMENASGMEFLHIDMWTADATDVQVTPINNSGSPAEALVGMTPINAGQWNSYDIPLSEFTNSGMTLNELIQMKFDGQAGVTPSNIWVDNIYFYKAGGSATEPTSAAPAPPARDAANVLSVFSDAYANIDISELNPDWGQTTVVTTEDIAGNQTLKYANFNYQGMQFAGMENASGMEFLHIDMWTADATDVQVTPINNSGSPVEALVGMAPINAGQWNSYDIPLSEYTNSGMTLNELVQMKFDGQAGVTPSNLWIDNIYFYKSGGSAGDWTTDDVIDFETTGFGASWTWAVFENDSNPPLEFVANPDASGENTSATVAKITALQSGQPWVGCETKHGDIGSFTFDASNATVRMMVYKSVISDVGIKFAENNGEAQPEVKVANTKINEWEELTFDLSGSIGAGITGIIDQIIVFPDFDLGGRTSDNVVYFDNIRFSAN